MVIDEEIRRQLAIRARSTKTRSSEFRPGRPTDWRPEQVHNPAGVLNPWFIDSTAWDLIATQLEEEHPVETVVLTRPRGRTGYVMKIDIGQERLLYVKVQFEGKKIIGRSFHYSEHPAHDSED